MSTLAVTGSTGQIGGRVARRLAALDVPQRLLVRDPSRAPSLPLSTVVPCDYGTGAVVALEGVRTLLMVSAAEAPDRLAQHLAFVDAAAEAGVEHVVYLSFFGAAADATFTLARDHWATEEHLRASGMRWTFLRDSFYADLLPELLTGPAGDGRVAAVTREDVADCVVAVLQDPSAHAGATYSLTGPEALTLTEVGALVGQPFVDQTLEQARASRMSYGVEEWQLQAWISTYTAIAAGEMAGVTGDVERLSGHPATSVRDALS